MDTQCSVCNQRKLLYRSGHPIHEPEGFIICRDCDEISRDFLRQNYSDSPTAMEFAQATEDFWKSPSVTKSYLNLSDDIGGHPSTLGPGMKRPDRRTIHTTEGPFTLQVLEGGGTDPRKPEDPKPPLRVVGWKIIKAAIPPKCYCVECEVERENRPPRILPNGKKVPYQTGHDVDLLVESDWSRREN